MPDLQQLEPDEQQIVQLLLEGELPFDSLMGQMGMTAGSLGACLTMLNERNNKTVAGTQLLH